MAAITLPDRVMGLDDPGDVQAPKGSQAWARAIRYQLERLDREGKARVRDFQIYLRLMEDHHGYEQFEDAEGHPFPSLSAFTCGQLPFGLGYDPEVLLRIQQETRDMLLGDLLGHGGDRRSQEFQVDNCQLEKTKGGNDPKYLRRVLQRDYPAIFQALERKEYRSVHAAAKAAGLVQDPTPLQLLFRAWKKTSEAERLQFFRELPDSERELLLKELAAIA